MELYAGIEPIPDVSQPKEDNTSAGPQTSGDAERMFDRIKSALGA